MKTYIYNENCIRAGQTVPERIIEQHENPDEGGDWTMYEGTDEELGALADATDAANHDPYSTYRAELAESLRDAAMLP